MLATAPQESKREHLLRLRDTQTPGFLYVEVPMFDTEVSPDAFAALRRERTDMPQAAREDLLAFRKTSVTDYLRELRTKQLAVVRSHQKKQQLEDVVNETYLPDMGTLGGWIASKLAPTRPLQPKRQSRKAVIATAPDSCRLMVRVSRAFSLPSRTPPAAVQFGSAPATDEPGHLAAQAYDAALRPLVEVSFQSNSKVTAVAHGVNPSWNQELFLPYSSPHNDFSLDVVARCHDMISFNVFDVRTVLVSPSLPPPLCEWRAAMWRGTSTAAITASTGRDLH